ncbi:hypothetical protein H632_c2609p0, partial [Helicosporidium sp. ATCC 50920]
MAEAPALSRYAVHDAAELGDVETLARLLAPVDGLGPDELDCVRLLLQAGASPTAPLEGSPPLHLAVCAGGLEGLEAFALSAARLLLACPQVAPFERDDGQRTALHWAAQLGLTDLCGELSIAAEAWVAREEAQAGVFEAGKDGSGAEAAKERSMEVAKEGSMEVAKEGSMEVAKEGSMEVAKERSMEVATEAVPSASARLPSLLVFTDRHGDAPLHLAALAAQPAA